MQGSRRAEPVAEASVTFFCAPPFASSVTFRFPIAFYRYLQPTTHNLEPTTTRHIFPHTIYLSPPFLTPFQGETSHRYQQRSW